MRIRYSITVDPGDITSIDYETAQALCNSAILNAGSRVLAILAKYPNDGIVIMHRGVPFRIAKEQDEGSATLVVEAEFRELQQ